MHCVIREYKLVRGDASEIVEPVRSQFLPIVEAIPGFTGYTVALTDDRELITTTVFADEKGAQASVEAASAWLRTTPLAEMFGGPPRVISGTMLVREVGERTSDTGFGIMRRFEIVPTDVERLAQMVRDGLVPMLKRSDRFLSYGLIDTHDAHIVSLTAFADEASARESHADAMAWVAENLAGIPRGEPEVKMARILFRKSAPRTAAVG
jgi:hypothetical protein